MKETTIIITIFCWVNLSFGQKFMIKGNDTLPYQWEMAIRENGDTIYYGACRTFEIVNGQIVNQTDRRCLRQGFWIITDSLGNYWKGAYRHGKRKGTWKHFDKNGKLLRETENVFFGKHTEIVKEIDYTSGQPVVLINNPFLAFYIKNLAAIMIILFVTFFGRVFINSRIYNIENGTNLSPIVTPFGRKNSWHNLLCTFTLWFSNYKPENRRLVIISNTMSVTALAIFFGILIGLAITGNIK